MTLVGSVTIAFTAWGLAGYVTWTLHAMLVGGLLTCALAVLPLPARFNGSDGEHGNWKNLKRLLLCPAFWFGAAFLIYITIQGFNPASEVVRNERGWWVQVIPAPLGNGWPTGVRSDYEPMNAFRVLASFTAAFSLMWGLWGGIRRRKTAIVVLWVFTLSGVGMGMVAILQHLSDAKEVLWTVPSNNAQFWGSFFYRNQGAAYLNLILVACGFLYFYHAQKTRAAGQSGGPHLLLFCFFALVVTSIGLALSRGGILFAAILTIAFCVLAFIQWLAGLFQGNSMRISLAVGSLLLLGLFSIIRYVDIEAIDTRFGDIDATIQNAEKDARALSTQATWDMAQARWVTGWGAGSFRYIFPVYQREYPRIFYTRHHHKKGWTGRKLYRYAHNDIVQFLAEYGAIGCGLLLSMLASVLWTALRGLRANPLSAILLILGLTCAFAHAVVDFIFNSPAYWVAFVGFLAISCKLLKLEDRRAEGRGRRAES